MFSSLPKNYDFAWLVGQMVGLIDTIIPVLASVAILIFFVGLVRYIRDTGDAHGHTSGKELIMWGLVSMFVIFSLWGIIALACGAVFNDSMCNTVQNVQCTGGQCYGPY